MPSILLLLLLGSVLFQSDERLGRTFSYCTDGTDFLIEHRDVYLPTEFSEARLKEYFSRYLKHPGEIYITASNDHDFIKRLWVTEGGPTLYDLDIREPLQTDKPLAYFYKIGRDAFFEYRDAQGRTGWATLQGENLFHRSFSGHVATLRGFKFVGSRDDRSCMNRRRDLSFVVGSLAEMTHDEILALVAFYDARLPYPQTLLLRFDETHESARRGKDMSYKLPPLTLSHQPQGKDVRGVFYLRNDRVRLIRIYDYGKLVYTKEW
jgi:hypothetical protein